ncbi:MAG: hypothetical protein SCH39_02585 [Methanosarcinales archaeon]|nr:hypothetical protein [Methanosarcinales archaeon]
MLNRMKKILILLIITIYLINSSGCTEKSQPPGGINYRINIWTDESAILYLPLPLDLPSYSVSDLTSKIEITEKSGNTDVSYEVINTTYGHALKISTTGNVFLSARVGKEYFETHPEVPMHPFIPGQNEPMFLDLSLQKNRSDKLNYERWAYLETENNKYIDIKIFEYLVISDDFGSESWKSRGDNSSYYGNFTLLPGWQIVRFNHNIYYV